MSIELPLHLEARRRKERPSFAAATRALRDALVAESSEPVARSLVSGVSPDDVLFAARIHGVSGLLARLPDLPGALGGELSIDVERLAARAARLAEDLSRLGERAGRKGLPFVPLKGGILAFSRYADPSLRPLADLDVLAPPGTFEAWTELLLEEGYEVRTRGERDWVLARPGARRPDDFREHPDNPRPVELHRSLAVRLLGRTVDVTPRYLAGLAPSTVLGQPALVPPDGVLFLHLLVHAGPALGGRGVRLIQLHDLGLVRPGRAEAAPARELLGEAAWGLSALAARALPGTLPATYLEALPSPSARRLRRWLARPGLADGTRERTVLLLSELGLCASLGDAAGRIGDAWPESTFVSRAYGGAGAGSFLRYYRDRVSR